jgi:hypothetical protein
MQIPISTAILSSLLTGLIGLLVGNRLAIDRDKRKEFNSLAKPIRTLLMREGENATPFSESTDRVTFMLYREQLPFWKQKVFDLALQNYRNSKGEQNQKRDAMGGVSYKNQTIVVENINRLLKFIEPK